MSLILCIETGTDVCSVALAHGGRLVSLREEAGRDHARKVALFADELFREAGISPRGLDAVAVGRGPGSYTGLRIGTSFAKGLCYALDVPLLAVDSLAAMAVIACDDREAGLFRSAQWESALLCPMIDARRMEVYAEVFDTSLESRSEVAAEVVTSGSFGRFIRPEGEFFVFGSGQDGRGASGRGRPVHRCSPVRPGALQACSGPARRGTGGGYRLLRTGLPERFRGDGRPEKIVLRK